MIPEHEVLEHLTLLSVNAASGLSLGMSVVVLGDVVHWKWSQKHPWLLAIPLVALWLPFALSGIIEVRRIGNTIVSIYMCWLFLTYDIRVRALANAAATRVCPNPQAGRCVPAPRSSLENGVEP